MTKVNYLTLTAAPEKGFVKIKCITEDHTKPFETTQNFLLLIYAGQ